MKIKANSTELQGVRRRAAQWVLRVLMLLGLCLALCVSTSFGQRVAIGLYDNIDLQAVRVTPVSRGYRAVFDGQVRPLPVGCILSLDRDGERLAVRIDGQQLGRYRHVVVLNDSATARVQVKSGDGQGGVRELDGNLSVSVDFRRVMCINLVDQESYVAGVVLAEVGGGQEIELYKAQALLVRTYLLAHRSRHISEGFNLCDQVHCQAYVRSAYDNKAIREAIEATRGLVVVDREGRLILSVFHANCGGQTASAEQVWLTPCDYLKGVIDADCGGASGSRWTSVVSLQAWRRFLKSKGIAAEGLTAQQMSYRSTHREALYTLPGGRGVPFRDLREYFNLRSAWFDVEVRGDRVHLQGRGYGHGIGMCQRGAMAKARKGYDALRILQAYFTGVSVVPAERALPMAALEDE